MKDEELKLEEIETSLTLGGVVMHTQIRQSLGLSQPMSVWVEITDAFIPAINYKKSLFIIER